MTITACTASHPMLVMERCLLGWKTNLFFLSIPLLYGGFCGENLDELKRWWVSSTTDCARQKTRVNNIFSQIDFLTLISFRIYDGINRSNRINDVLI